jgi:hypothetical protein
MIRHSASAIVAAALLGGLSASEGAVAGQFKFMQQPVPNASCVYAYVTPTNQSTAMTMGVFEFVTPAADNYRCCITANSTGQDLYVNMLGLTGVPLGSFQTPVNGGGCTPFRCLGAGFAFQCKVASGPGSAATPNSVYRFAVCRQ